MWFTNLKLVLPDRVVERGALAVEGGRIVAVHEGAHDLPGINCAGLLAIPGIVDLHGDMLERDIEPRPRAFFPVDMALYELDKRLAATGITTAYAAVSFAWNKSDLRRTDVAVDIIETVNRLRPTLLVDTLVHARFEVGFADTVPVLAGLLERDLVHLVSIMDHTPGQGQYRDVAGMSDIVMTWLNLTEADELYHTLRARMQERMQAVEQAVARRDWSVVEQIAALALAKGVPLASHDDDTPQKVEEQAALGVRISEFPVSLSAAQAARARGMHVIMGAPNAYRGASNTGNLSALDAIRAGVVDSLATDYVPAAPLQAVFRMAREGELPLHEGIRLITLNPARAVGMTDRGALEAGQWADFALIEEGQPPRVRATFRHGNAIYADITLAQRTSAPQAHG